MLLLMMSLTQNIHNITRIYFRKFEKRQQEYETYI